MEKESVTGRAGEDLLEAVLILSENYYFVRSIDVAHYLGITKATVSSTTKNLEKDGLLNKSEETG